VILSSRPPFPLSSADDVGTRAEDVGLGGLLHHPHLLRGEPPGSPLLLGTRRTNGSTWTPGQNGDEAIQPELQGTTVTEKRASSTK